MAQVLLGGAAKTLILSLPLGIIILIVRRATAKGDKRLEEARKAAQEENP